MRPFTLAFRGMSIGRYGNGAEDPNTTWPIYLGDETMIRGYGYGSFSADECQVYNRHQPAPTAQSRLPGVPSTCSAAKRRSSTPSSAFRCSAPRDLDCSTSPSCRLKCRRSSTPACRTRTHKVPISVSRDRRTPSRRTARRSTHDAGSDPAAGVLPVRRPHSGVQHGPVVPLQPDGLRDYGSVHRASVPAPDEELGLGIPARAGLVRLGEPLIRRGERARSRSPRHRVSCTSPRSAARFAHSPASRRTEFARRTSPDRRRRRCVDHRVTRDPPALYAASTRGSAPYWLMYDARCAVPSCRLASASKSSAGYQTGYVRAREISSPTAGSTCISPRAPATDTARALKLDSWRIRPGDERRIEPRALCVARKLRRDRPRETADGTPARRDVRHRRASAPSASRVTLARLPETRVPSRRSLRRARCGRLRARRTRSAPRRPFRVAREAPRARSRCRPTRRSESESAAPVATMDLAEPLALTRTSNRRLAAGRSTSVHRARASASLPASAQARPLQ